MFQVVRKIRNDGDGLRSGSLWVLLLLPCLLCLLEAGELVGVEVAPEEVGWVGKGGRNGLSLVGHVESGAVSDTCSNEVEVVGEGRRTGKSPRCAVKLGEMADLPWWEAVGIQNFPPCATQLIERVLLRQLSVGFSLRVACRKAARWAATFEVGELTLMLLPAALLCSLPALRQYCVQGTLQQTHFIAWGDPCPCN